MLRDQLIGDLYEAAIHPDGYLEVFQSVVETLGSNLFHMFSWDAQRNTPHYSTFTPNLNLDATIQRYDRYYAALDPRRSFVEKAAIGTIVCCQDYLSEQDVARSEFFQDHQIPAGLRYLMGVRLARAGGDDILLGLMRATGRPPYTPEERTAAQGMTVHLQRSLNLWQDAKVLHRDAALGNELMEQLGLAVFALNKTSRIVFANQAGEAMLRANATLKLAHGRLAVIAAADNDALQGAIARVAKTRKGESLALRPAPGVPHDIFLSITYLPGQYLRTAFGEAVVLITARRRGQTPLVSARQLRDAFRLTAAEAAVAEALICGKTPDEYAAAVGVSVATVRTQLRAIFDKTSTRSQVEAVGAMLWVLSQAKRDP